MNQLSTSTGHVLGYRITLGVMAASQPAAAGDSALFVPGSSNQHGGSR
jgi:hypothetical protein